MAEEECQAYHFNEGVSNKCEFGNFSNADGDVLRPSFRSNEGKKVHVVVGKDGNGILPAKRTYSMH